ncbi:MAG: hypothetical protein ACLRFR_01265, partial [Clostridia bacterium]
MKKSRVFTLGLACFLSAVTAFSALAPTSGGGALLRNLSDNSAHSEASQAGQIATENSAETLSAEVQAKAELDAKILAGGGLGLDPENDPIIATTDWGLDIKFHNDWGTFGTSANSGGVAGYVYFTMGKYDNQDVNWVIIGQSTVISYYDGTHHLTYKKYTSYNFIEYLNQTTSNASFYKNNQYEIYTEAGSVIEEAGNNGLIYDFEQILFANAVSNETVSNELNPGEVLCLSEKVIFNTSFNTRAKGNNYSGSNLQTQITKLDQTLGLTSTQVNQIQPQDFQNYSYNATTDSKNHCFFPLAALGEKFSIGTYLSNKV